MDTVVSFDVIIIGGSYAGLSAAMALGRSLRNVLVIDSGLPCNRQTPHSHNFITQDGERPHRIIEKARAQVLKYPTVKLLEAKAVEGQKKDKSFTITVESGSIYHAGKLIFATGLRDRMPDIEGFSACWGISVIHCPYCHGYEVRNEKTVILANGDAAMHYAQLIRNLTKNLTILTNGIPEFSKEQYEKLKKYGIDVITNEIASLTHEKGLLHEVVFKDKSRFPVHVMYARPQFEQHCPIAEMLGCSITETGHIFTDAFQKTTVPDIYACGDNSGMMRSVAHAVYTGNLAGAMINNELTAEAFK